MRKTASVVTKARERLRAAIDHACIARGEAQWTNGYRTAVAAGVRRPVNDPESQRLYLMEREMVQFKQCGTAEKTVERAMRAYAVAIRKGKG